MTYSVTNFPVLIPLKWCSQQIRSPGEKLNLIDNEKVGRSLKLDNFIARIVGVPEKIPVSPGRSVSGVSALTVMAKLFLIAKEDKTQARLRSRMAKPKLMLRMEATISACSRAGPRRSQQQKIRKTQPRDVRMRSAFRRDVRVGESRSASGVAASNVSVAETDISLNRRLSFSVLYNEICNFVTVQFPRPLKGVEDGPDSWFWCRLVGQ